MIEMKAIFVFFMALVMNVSSVWLNGSHQAIDSFFSENDFSHIFGLKQIYCFVKYLNGSHYNVLTEEKRLGKQKTIFFETGHPCVQNIKLNVESGTNFWRITFKDCQRNLREEGETKNIWSPDIQFVGFF